MRRLPKLLLKPFQSNTFSNQSLMRLQYQFTHINHKLFPHPALSSLHTSIGYEFRAKEGFKKQMPKLEIETHYNVSDLTRCIYRRLSRTNIEYKEIQRILSQDLSSAAAAAASNSSQAQSQNGTNTPVDHETLRKKLNQLQPLNDTFEKIDQMIRNLQSFQQQKLDPSNNDPELLELIQAEIDSAVESIDELQDECLDQLLPKGKHDDCSEITVEVRPGAGGSESSLFAEEVVHMYMAYLQDQGLQCAIDSFLPDISINKGCRLGVIKASGHEIYKRMMNESGVHKVIRVPETEAKGRLHSSTISVVVMPVVPMDFKVDEKDLRYEFMRSQGAGGQHVNKVESACRITHIPTGVTSLCQDDRQQERNKQRALKLLTQKLFQLEVERTNEENSSQRKSQIGGGDRSDKIRTYNFPQSRITDHRTNLTLFGVDRMMKGEFLQEFIDSFQDKIISERIEDLLKQLEEEDTSPSKN